MVVIRLARGGAKKRPFYHIVVADKHRARDGKYIERLGFYNPTATGAEVGLTMVRERVTHWVANGAQLSDKVRDLVKVWDKQATAA
ncbi:MAG TPA: 30S ribosomal protein S16 [Gammaproteobacteria bacterium]|nr:30S ribosomal protein S16 [Gammaproteobacteria bacterium]